MKKTKLSVELIFIFILPLLFMLFNFTYSDVASNGVVLINFQYESLFVNSTSPINLLFNILFNVLDLNTSNVLFNLLIDYTSLWFIMFIIWHIFYGLFDVLIHLFTKSKYKEGE